MLPWKSELASRNLLRSISPKQKRDHSQANSAQDPSVSYTLMMSVSHTGNISTVEFHIDLSEVVLIQSGQLFKASEGQDARPVPKATRKLTGANDATRT